MELNAYAIVILAALLVDYGLKLVADGLNLGALQPDPPAALGDLYDAVRYRRSQEYTRVRTRFSLIPATFDLVVLLSFWFAGGFNRLDQIVRGLGLGEIAGGLVYIGGLVAAMALLALPFDYYATFAIEARFGFNRTSRRTFWLDRLKGAGLAVVLGGPLLASVLALFAWAGNHAWIYGWLCATAYLLAVQYLAPTWLMPLFNRFTPLEEGELREAILALARRLDFPLTGIFVIDGSKRSSKANAFFTGFGRNKRIALFDTLIENHPTEELVAIVAHEIGHYKRGHILQGTVLTVAHLGVLFALLSICLGRPGLFAAFGMEETSIHAGLVFFALLYTPVEMVLSLALHARSRRNEYQADRYALDAVGSRRPLVTGLKRLSTDHLANLTPHPLYVALHYSHPTLLQRLEALQK